MGQNHASTYRKRIAGLSAAIVGVGLTATLAVMVDLYHISVEVERLELLQSAENISDMAAIRAPFIQAEIILALFTALLVGLGLFIFFRFVSPIVSKMATSESHLRDLIENMQEGVAVYRAVDDGRDFVIVDFNRGGEVIVGMDRRDLIGQLVTDCFPGVQDFGLLDVLRSVWKTGKPERLPVKYYRDDEREGWRENQVIRLSSGDVAAIYSDLTESMEVKKSLEESVERFDLAMKGATDGLWDWEVNTDTVFYSPRWKSMLGYSADEIGNDFEEWKSRVHPDDLGPALTNIEDYIAGRIPTFRQAFRMRHKNGSWVHILARAHGVWDKDGELVRLVGTHVDVTSLRQAEEALKQEKERAEQYLDIAGNMFVVIDPEGSVLLANRATHKVLEMSESELVGKNWFETALPAERRADIRKVFQKIIAGDAEGVRHLENEVLTRTGERRMIAWHNRVMKDQDGQVVATLSSGEDITEHRRVEATLRELEFIVEHSPTVAFLWRAVEGWPVEYVSGNIRQFGYDPDELTSGAVAFADIVFDEDLQRIAEEVEHHTAEGGDEFSQEYRIRTKDGAIRWLDDHTWIRRNENGEATHYQGVVIDITDRKQTEFHLQQSNRALTAITNCNGIMVRAKTETALLDGICNTIVNVGGYPLAWVGIREEAGEERVIPASVSGTAKSFLEKVEIFWTPKKTTGQGPTGTAIRTGKPVVIRDTTTDPAYQPWREWAAKFGLYSVISLPLTIDRDVIGILSLSSSRSDAFDETETSLLTELAADLSYGIASLRAKSAQTKAEHALDISALQLKTITDRNVDALVIVNEQGKVRFANPAAEKLFGRDITGGEPLSLGTSISSKWQRLDILRPENGPAIAEYRAVSIPWDEEACQLIVLRDITEKVEMDKALIHFEKIEALGTLAGGVVHDVKNMLFPILSLTEMNMQQFPEGSREHIRASKVLMAAHRIQELVVKLLAFSRRSEDEPVRESVTLHGVVGSALELLRGTLPSTVNVISEFDEKVDRVRVDKARFVDAILNLATNATHAMKNKVGDLRIAIDHATIDENNLPNVIPLPPGSYARLSISDTGCGMDRKTLTRAFDPFFTTKDEGEGTGLGLPLVLNFVRQHEGGLSVSSIPGEGTTFELFLQTINNGNGDTVNSAPPD